MVKKAASKKIVLASDPFGVSLKSAIKEHLLGKGYEVIDLGTDSIEHFVPYFEISAKAARAASTFPGVSDPPAIRATAGTGVAPPGAKVTFAPRAKGLVELGESSSPPKQQNRSTRTPRLPRVTRQAGRDLRRP